MSVVKERFKRRENSFKQRNEAQDQRMAEIRWTEEAVLWLQEINDYLLQSNPTAAQRVVEGNFD